MPGKRSKTTEQPDKYREEFKLLLEDGILVLEDISACSYKLDEDNEQGLHSLETKHLMTRSTQLLSWLFLQRAVYDGDMSLSQAKFEQSKIALEDPVLDGFIHGKESLPGDLSDLILRAIELQHKIREYLTSSPVNNFSSDDRVEVNDRVNNASFRQQNEDNSGEQALSKQKDIEHGESSIQDLPNKGVADQLEMLRSAFGCSE